MNNRTFIIHFMPNKLYELQLMRNPKTILFKYLTITKLLKVYDMNNGKLFTLPFFKFESHKKVLTERIIFQPSSITSLYFILFHPINIGRSHGSNLARRIKLSSLD